MAWRRCGPGPPVPRGAALALAIWSALAAFAVVTALRDPLCDTLSSLLLPGLRRSLLLYAAALGAVAAVSLVAAVAGQRPLLFAASVAAGCLAAASVLLAYEAQRSTGRLGLFLQEECRRLDAGASPQVSFTELGLQELREVLQRCREGDAGAVGLDDCRELASEMNLEPRGRRDYFMRLERGLETQLGCTGLCQSLGPPLFASGSLSAAHQDMPACRLLVSARASKDGFDAALCLGVLNAPGLLALASAVLCSLAPTATVSGHSYQKVPSSVVEVTLRPAWPE